MTPPIDPVVVLEREGGLAVLTLSSPPLNLFSQAVLDQLAARLGELHDDPPRALLICGAGDVTSGGVDVQLFTTGGRDEFAHGARTSLQSIIAPLEALPCPTVAACHGVCLTAAFELALACDLIVAAEGTQFGLVEASLGLTPAMGGTQRLAAKVGEARAAELVLTSKLYDARTLHDWGAVTRVYDAERFATSTRKFAARLAEGPTRAHAATKQVLAAYRRGGIKAADAVVPDQAAALFDTDDLTAGIASFLENGPGKATFSGR